MSTRSEKNKTIFKFSLIVLLVLIVLGAINYLISKNPIIILKVQQFTEEYGLVGGIIVTYIASLWFVVFPWELIVGPILIYYPIPIIPIFIFALTAVFAHILNFYMGRKVGEEFICNKINPKKLKKIQKFLDKYGIYTMFIFGVIGPFTSYDILSLVLGGFSKIKYKLFILVTLIAQILHFIVLFLLAKLALNAALLAF